MIHSILPEHKQISNLDAVTLLLIDPHFEIQRILIELEIGLDRYTDLFFIEDITPLSNLYRNSKTPILCPFLPHSHAFLFPENQTAYISSVALLPLIRKNKLIGSLNLGSSRADRFRAGMATDFLARLANIVAISLESVTNHEKLKHVSLTDTLTGINNRRYFEQRLAEEINRARRQGTPLSCLMLDIDHFKKVNDDHGHLTGDGVLREIAHRVKAQLRLSDALGRYGGEEFAVLLVGNDENGASYIGERIRSCIADKPFYSPELSTPLTLTLSIGIATLTDLNQTCTIEDYAIQLIADADKALYQAKQQGRNLVVTAGT